MYTYILQSEIDNSYYIGSTNNLSIRLVYHNNGRSKYTSRKRPWKLIYYEEFLTLSEARSREKQIKSWHSRKAVERLLNKAPSSSG
ncbi:GIY-YIG nuclease family protein [Candidatus Shapirobacteria bacterium]|nr:GIY-YIG nuclease family protein [Candidatus Shapirobacteria bacterium]